LLGEAGIYFDSNDLSSDIQERDRQRAQTRTDFKYDIVRCYLGCPHYPATGIAIDHEILT
jgi:hypothetical protein